MQLTREDIQKVIREKQLTTFEQIQDETDAGSICGACVAEIEKILEEELRNRQK